MSNLSQFVSQYADTGKVLSNLLGNNRLNELAYEFCAKFNTRLYQRPDANPDNGIIYLRTQGGLPAGYLRTARDSEGEYFIYGAEHIKKSRSSSRTGRDQRDANKISALLRVIAANGEAPNEQNITEKFKGGIRYAFGTTKITRRVTLEVPYDLTMKMVEGVLKINEQNLTNSMDTIQNIYDDYLLKCKQAKETNMTHKRFAEGSKLIGICRVPNTMDQFFYLVGEATFEEEKGDDKVYITTPLKYHKSLSEVPELVSDTAIIRTYFETHKDQADLSNELGAPRCDRYFEDIDIAVGYLERDNYWVLIPKTAP